MLSPEMTSTALEVMHNSVGKLAKLQTAGPGDVFLQSIVNEYFELIKLVHHILEKEAPSSQLRDEASMALVRIDLVNMEFNNWIELEWESAHSIPVLEGARWGMRRPHEDE